MVRAAADLRMVDNEPGQTISFEGWLAGRRLRFGLFLGLVATLLAVLFMTQDYRQLNSGLAVGPPLGKIARQRFIIWYLWALLTPAIILIGHQIRALHVGTPARLSLWVMHGLGVGVVHSAVFGAVVESIPWLAITKPAGGIGIAIWERAGATYAANLLVFALIALAYHAAANAYEVRQSERQAAQLEARLARSELEVLKMQLQPHFMFNTLQTASALMEYNVGAARRVLTSLGSLLRFSLDNLGTQEIPLRDELAVLRQYVDIQRARFRDRLQVILNVDPNAENLMVPSLLLQPLVENAIRHGVEQLARGGTIEIRIERIGDLLSIAVVDDGPGLIPHSGGPTSVGNGVGLANTRARLRQMYGSAAKLELANRSSGGCWLEVVLPAREAPTSAGRS